MVQVFVRSIIASLVAGYLALHGYKKKSLDITGSIAAFVVGFASFQISIRFGLLLIIFYYTSSKFTKLNEKRKAELEDEYQVGGQRNATQVLANSILATIVAVLYWVYIGEDDHLLPEQNDIDMLSLGPIRITKTRLGMYLWCAYVAHYACAAGDTWASEIGVLNTSAPRLVTTLFLRSVPPGTNGGMSLLGTAASAAGGLCIGVSFFLLGVILPGDAMSQAPMILVGALCGLFGSLVDSLLGATLQASYYSKEKKKIVRHFDERDESLVRICGMDVLSNEAVNFISIAITMLAAAFVGEYVFCACSNLYCK